MSRGIFAQIAAAGSTAINALQAQVAQIGQTASTAQATATAAASPGATVHADLYAKIAALQAALAAITPGISTVALAQGVTTAVLLNASADITLTLSHTMPDTSYTVEPPRLGSATFVVKSKTTTTITFTMTASGLAISAGQPLVAAAWK